MPRQQRSHATQARILEAAQMAFSRNGYDATGVAEICQAAGVSKGAFYHHFASKQAVFLMLLDMWLAELDENLRAAQMGSNSVAAALAQMAGKAPGMISTGDGRMRMLLEFWSKAIHDPDVWQEAIRPYQHYQAYFAELVRAGIASGEFRPIDPDVSGRMIVGLAIGILMQNLLDPAGANWAATMRESLPLLIDGLRAPGHA